MTDSPIPKNGQASGDQPKPGDLIADKYQIGPSIGSGGMAEVFSGVNLRTGKRVALKWIRPALATSGEARLRFGQEAMAAGRINHPNVVSVFDVIGHGSATWLVMELLEGSTLAEMMARVGPMEPQAAIDLLIPAVRGVAAAHAHGVVHRDLKPENIFICRSTDGRPREPKVLDFGMSKLIDGSIDPVGITARGNLVGTPAYMAPEQVRGHASVDGRSDVYALGVVLYQMLSGRRPFEEQNYSALLFQIATTDPPSLRSLRPDVPVEIEAIVRRAMSRAIDQRFPDALAFLRALEDPMHLRISRKIDARRSILPGVARREDPTPPAIGELKKWLKRPARLWTLVSASLLVCVVGVVIALRAAMGPIPKSRGGTADVGTAWPHVDPAAESRRRNLTPAPLAVPTEGSPVVAPPFHGRALSAEPHRAPAPSVDQPTNVVEAMPVKARSRIAPARTRGADDRTTTRKPEAPTARDPIVTEPPPRRGPAAEPIGAARGGVDPAGGSAPLRPIETRSPYRLP